MQKCNVGDPSEINEWRDFTGQATSNATEDIPDHNRNVAHKVQRYIKPIFSCCSVSSSPATLRFWFDDFLDKRNVADKLQRYRSREIDVEPRGKIDETQRFHRASKF
jgi:hypothetical protein